MSNINKIWLLYIIISLVHINAGAQWNEIFQYASSQSTSDEIAITSDGKVFIMTNDTIFRSTDLGETWSFDMNWQFGPESIQFVSSDTGYVCCFVEGYEEDHLITIDGGLTWEPCGGISDFYYYDIVYRPNFEIIGVYMGADLVNFIFGKYCNSLILENDIISPGEATSLEVVNDSVYFISGPLLFYDPEAPEDYSMLLKSNNAGETWHYSGSNIEVPYWGMSWPSDSIGYGNGLEHLYKTVDQGETWTRLPNPFGEDEFVYIYGVPTFVDDNIGYVTSGRYDPENLGEYENVGILRTENGGMSWIRTDYPIDSGCGLALSCINADTCYYLCKGRVYRTFNGGGIGDPLIISTLESLSISIYPNPATQAIRFQGLGNSLPAAITTFKIDGRMVDVPFHNGQADVSHLAPGIYITTVQTEQGKWQEKWVKY